MKIAAKLGHGDIKMLSTLGPAILALRLTMPFTAHDLATIETCFKTNGWHARKICQVLKAKKWNESSVRNLIQKIKMTGTASRKKGSGGKATACTPEAVEEIQELSLSQDSNPGTHMSQIGAESSKTAAVNQISQAS